MIAWFKRLFGLGPKPSLEDEALQDARDLEEQILHDELKLIDQRFKIDAHRAKKMHLIEWLQRQDRAQSRPDQAMLEKFGIVPRSGD